MDNYISIDDAWGEDILVTWYCDSIDDSIPPVWTPEHIEELCNDFYVIPKENTASGSEKLKKFIDSLSNSEKDVLYSHLRFSYVKTDVITFFENNSIAYDEDRINNIAMSYVNGKYDCNLSYWDNIANLIKQN